MKFTVLADVRILIIVLDDRRKKGKRREKRRFDSESGFKQTGKNGRAIRTVEDKVLFW